MYSAWLIMLASGNIGILLDQPKLFVSYLFCLPVGLLLDTLTVDRVVRSFNNKK